MNADIYRTGKKNTYLALPHGGSASSVSAEVLRELEPLEFWKPVELAPSIIAVNPKQVEKDLGAKGYSVFQAGVQFSEPKEVKII